MYTTRNYNSSRNIRIVVVKICLITFLVSSINCNVILTRGNNNNSVIAKNYNVIQPNYSKTYNLTEINYNIEYHSSILNRINDTIQELAIAKDSLIKKESSISNGKKVQQYERDLKELQFKKEQFEEVLSKWKKLGFTGIRLNLQDSIVPMVDPYLFKKYYAVDFILEDKGYPITVSSKSVWVYFKLEVNTHKGSFVITYNEDLYFTPSDSIFEGETYTFYEVKNAFKSTEKTVYEKAYCPNSLFYKIESLRIYTCSGIDFQSGEFFNKAIYNRLDKQNNNESMYESMSVPVNKTLSWKENIISQTKIGLVPIWVLKKPDANLGKHYIKITSSLKDSCRLRFSDDGVNSAFLTLRPEEDNYIVKGNGDGSRIYVFLPFERKDILLSKLITDSCIYNLYLENNLEQIKPFMAGCTFD